MPDIWFVEVATPMGRYAPALHHGDKPTEKRPDGTRVYSVNHLVRQRQPLWPVSWPL